MNRRNLEEKYTGIEEKISRATGGVHIQADTFFDYYLPLINSYIQKREDSSTETFVVGIQGPIGIGKTVLATVIRVFLESEGYTVENFSIDNFYLPYEDRIRLSKQLPQNPFYQINRGMPGTHRIGHLVEVLEKARNGKSFSIPHFDKSLHSGKGDVSDSVTQIDQKLNFLILEGWCVFMPVVSKKRFLEIIKEDSYSYKILCDLDPAHEHLEPVFAAVAKYQDVWKLIDNRTILFTQNMEHVETWRLEQERRLIELCGSGQTEDEIKTFVKPFIPFSYFVSEGINKEKVDHTVTIGRNHLPISIV